MIRAYTVSEPGGRFELREYDPGPLAEDAVEVRVESCGVCHSDLSLRDDEWGMSRYPFAPGHEAIGVVESVGRAVAHLQPGDRVGVGWFSRSCQACDPCVGGDQNLCPSGEMTAVRGLGGFADRLRVQAAWAVKLPDGLDARAAGPLFCGGITVFNPLLQFGVKPTDRVGVVGIGGLGHLALQFLNAWGCEVTAFTSTGAKAEEARRLGAHRVVDSRDPKALEAEAGRFDFVMSTVAVTLDWQAYLEALAPKGRLHNVGAAPDPIPAPPFTMIMAQRQLSGSPVGAPLAVRKMLEFSARHGIAPQVETMKMSEIDAAFDKLRSGSPRYRIVLEADFA